MIEQGGIDDTGPFLCGGTLANQKRPRITKTNNGGAPMSPASGGS
jgi:hypothetical protein